jgi:hypothetical protein
MKTIHASTRAHHLARFCIFLITAALIVGMAGCDGCTPSQNLEIRDWYDLDAVRNNLGGHHILMNDLNSTTPGYEELAGPTADEGKGWYPIGIFSQGGDMEFIGTLDGQGHEIWDLFIDRPSHERPNNGSGIGLIGVLGQRGVVENIGLVNVSVIGTSCVGGLVAYSHGTVSRSYCTGKVTGVWHVGGLVGWNEGDVSDSYSTGSVTGDEYVGGLVGDNDGAVSNSCSTGSVTGTEWVGGLVGMSRRDTVSDSFWDMETSRQSTSDGGTGKTTAEMQDIATFLDADWNIIAVANPDTRNPSYIWNIVDDETYTFMSWQP